MLLTPIDPSLEVAPARLPAFGHLSGVAKDTMYSLKTAGFVFASPWVCSPRTARHAAVLLLSTSGRPFTLQTDTRRISTCAAFVPPLAARSLDARDVGLVSINFTPGHAAYADLRRRGGDEVLALESGPFAPLHADLCRLYRAELTLPQVAHLMDVSAAMLQSQLPGKSGGPSRQHVELLSLVVSQPELTLPDIARLTGLSYDRASHALRDALGVPLKSYQCWRKMNDAADALFTPKLTLTEVAHQAGFSDSAHLSRTFKQQLGLSPTYMRQAAAVRVMF